MPLKRAVDKTELTQARLTRKAKKQCINSRTNQKSAPRGCRGFCASCSTPFLRQGLIHTAFAPEASASVAVEGPVQGSGAGFARFSTDVVHALYDVWPAPGVRRTRRRNGLPFSTARQANDYAVAWIAFLLRGRAVGAICAQPTVAVVQARVARRGETEIALPCRFLAPTMTFLITPTTLTVLLDAAHVFFSCGSSLAQESEHPLGRE